MRFKPYETIRISGVASSPNGYQFQDLDCVVATVSEGHIKVWPLDCSIGEPDKIWKNIA